MATFPTYGELVLPDYSEKPDSPVIRTEMESGPAKQARIKSKRNIQRDITFLFTAAERASFITWFTNSISLGNDWFDWVDPADGAAKLGRIVDAKYEAKPYIGSDSSLAWAVSFLLETVE